MCAQRLGQPIAEGRTAVIYAWRAGAVLKVFRDWFPRADIEYEARIARAVHSAGLRVPEVGEIVEVEGRLGLEYERLEGVSLWDEMRAKPWALGKYSRLLAQLHTDVHAILDPGDIPELKGKLERRIRPVPELRAKVREALLAGLQELPNGNNLCHGDFHPDNVILTQSGPVVIDWIDASVGSPPADVARTTILAMGEVVSGGTVNFAERVALQWGHRSYRKRYFQLRPGGEEEYSDWLPIVAAARLSEGIRELAPWLRAVAEDGVRGNAEQRTLS